MKTESILETYSKPLTQEKVADTLGGIVLRPQNGNDYGAPIATIYAEDSAALLAQAPTMADALRDILEQCTRTDAGSWHDVASLKNYIASACIEGLGEIPA